MDQTLAGYVRALRAAGADASTAEALDAAQGGDDGGDDGAGDACAFPQRGEHRAAICDLLRFVERCAAGLDHGDGVDATSGVDGDVQQDVHLTSDVHLISRVCGFHEAQQLGGTRQRWPGLRQHGAGAAGEALDGR